MRIAVFGSGAVGGYYGARLAHAGHEVTFIARGAHLRAIRERGLLVWSPLGDVSSHAAAEEDPSRVGPVDLVLFAVKTYDLEVAVSRLPALVGPETVVLTLQNGIEAPEQVARVVGARHVVGGATYIGTALVAPGIIEQTGSHRRIVLGEVFDAGPTVSPRVAGLATALAAADVQAEPHADARAPLWEKFIFLASLAGACAAARVATGGIWNDPHGRALVIEAAREIERLARAEGVPVAPDVVERIVRYCDALPAAMRPSMFIDISAGKPLEVEALQGAVVRRGAAVGVPTPIMSTLYAVLKPHAAGRARPSPDATSA
jgi:2-dehydropantoate 2-reductase